MATPSGATPGGNSNEKSLVAKNKAQAEALRPDPATRVDFWAKYGEKTAEHQKAREAEVNANKSRQAIESEQKQKASAELTAKAKADTEVNRLANQKKRDDLLIEREAKIAESKIVGTDAGNGVANGSVKGLNGTYNYATKDQKGPPEKGIPNPKLQELAAKRKSQPGFFFVVVNSNGAADDNFELYFKPKNSMDQVKLPGTLDFTNNDVAGYYYSWGVTPKAEERVLAWLDENAFYYNNPTYKGKEVKRSKLRLRPEQEGELLLKNVQQNFNGNYGEIIYGFVGRRQKDFVNTIQYAEYSPRGGDDETVSFIYPPKR
jgi:hypothetical protein